MKVNPGKHFGRIEIIKRVVFIFLHHWVDTTAGRLSVVSEGIISSVVSTSVLT